jgi:hypothetical protein
MTLLAIPLLAAAAPVDHPVLLPTHDALVAYHLAPTGGEAIDLRVAFKAGAKQMRFNLPDTTYMIVTPATESVVMVVPLQRTTADLPWTAGPQSLFLLDPNAHFSRKGELTVAGQKCTQWDVISDQDKRTVCVTADGLVLRNQSSDPQGHRNLVEATIVRVEPVPAEVFVVPKGFENIPLMSSPPK